MTNRRNENISINQNKLKSFVTTYYNIVYVKMLTIYAKRHSKSSRFRIIRTLN